MPAAFYEFSVEQGSDFVTSFKILKPTGGLFNFLPANGASFWNSANTSLNFDVPEEIKLAYPENADSFGWLKNVTTGDTWVDRTFLTIRMKVKDNKGCQKLNGQRIYKAVRKTATNEIIVQQDDTNFIVDNSNPSSCTQIGSGAGAIKMKLFDNRTDYNANLIIPNANTSLFLGKYLYDIELEYRLGVYNSNPNNITTSGFVIRMLQGKMTFNPNITA
jgi:hypothetical protein